MSINNHGLQNVCAVVVTHDRPDYLRAVLQAYEEQTLPFQELCVVDNASGDDTVEFLKAWQEERHPFVATVLRLENNQGGAGGFRAGMLKALQGPFNWVFLADDDARPKADMLQSLSNGYAHLCSQKPERPIVALCTSVYEDGAISTLHRRRSCAKPYRIVEEKVPLEEYSDSYFEINEFSYVGVLLSAEALQKAGVTDDSFFIGYDDTEHSHRLAQLGKIYCIPGSAMEHRFMEAAHNQDSSGASKPAGWKEYYTMRNFLTVVKRYYPRRLFILHCARLYIKSASILSSLYGVKTSADRRVYGDAIKDAWNDRMGVVEGYRPAGMISPRR